MSKTIELGVIIATSFERTELLLNRSLESVLNQTYVPDYIVIVDDNRSPKVLHRIEKELHTRNIHSVCCIRNFKTKGNSGTGAWNSGVEFLLSKFSSKNNAYIALLDDDDEWSDTYLEHCIQMIKGAEGGTIQAVFANLVRLHKDFRLSYCLNENKMTIKDFLVGNPGVQGSNIFIKLTAFLEIGCFDETLPSCTDRDIMIRFLKRFSVKEIRLIEENLVWHYAQSDATVTNMKTSKWRGLDRFYDKYLYLYSYDLLEESLKRAEEYFDYPGRSRIMSQLKTEMTPYEKKL